MGRIGTVRSYFVMRLFRLIPETRFFALKRLLIRGAGVEVGDGTRICSSVTIVGGGSLAIGADAWIGHEVMIAASSRVTIGSRVDLAPRVYIGTGTHRPDPEGPRAAGEGLGLDVEIGDGAWIGACACILPGVRLGKNAIVAAGAVVTKDVPDKTVVGGVPAVPLKSSAKDA